MGKKKGSFKAALLKEKQFSHFSYIRGRKTLEGRTQGKPFLFLL
jgi:hypothetical protein